MGVKKSKKKTLIYNKIYRRNGGVLLKTFDSDGLVIIDELRTNRLKFISLILYSLSIILHTAAFSSLGIFYYSRVVPSAPAVT